MPIQITASVAAAIRGSVRFVCKIHSIQDGSLPISWLRTVVEDKQPKSIYDTLDHPIRRFQVIFHLENDPQRLVIVTVDVQKVKGEGGKEEWSAIYGALSFVKQAEIFLPYHCIFNVEANSLSIYDMQGGDNLPYPYAAYKA